MEWSNESVLEFLRPYEQESVIWNAGLAITHISHIYHTIIFLCILYCREKCNELSNHVLSIYLHRVINLVL